ncbi:MAG: hypothetical protein R3C11_16995 [Planctomycetaceae bacterium]
MSSSLMIGFKKRFGITGFIFVLALDLLTSIASGLGAEPLDVSFTAKSDGTEQKYVLLLPDNYAPDQPHSLMIALHGHGSDRWQFIKNTRAECAAAREAAAKYNMIYLSPDYRATTSWMGPEAEADLLQILKEMKANYKIDQTIIMGARWGKFGVDIYCIASRAH